MDEAQDMPPAEPDEDAKLMAEGQEWRRFRHGNAGPQTPEFRICDGGRMLNNGPETEDIAQQVFIGIWKGAGNYEPSARFTTWMFTILRNLVFNEVRRQKRNAHHLRRRHGGGRRHGRVSGTFPDPGRSTGTYGTPARRGRGNRRSAGKGAAGRPTAPFRKHAL